MFVCSQVVCIKSLEYLGWHSVWLLPSQCINVQPCIPQGLLAPLDIIYAIDPCLGSMFPYSTLIAHTLVFLSGDMLFFVDPFVFIMQANSNSVSACGPNLAPADSPDEDKDCCTAQVWELIRKDEPAIYFDQSVLFWQCSMVASYPTSTVM